ncbi:MAG: hypothetical protein OER86_14600, partial [Phycisphaerae bacterium]|nr:hypothetical protein [Phycisphaerae bacterium]
MRFRPLGFDTTSGVTGSSGEWFGLILLAALLAVALPAAPARAQAGRLDEAQFVEGLRQYGLSSLLEHYLKNNQIKDPLVAAQVNVEVARWQFERAVAGGSDDASQRGEAVIKAYQTLFEAAPVTDHRQPIWGTEYSIFILEQFLPQAFINAPEFVQFGAPKPSQRRAFDRLTAQAVEAMELAGDDLTVLLGRLPRRDDFVQKYQNTGVYQELQEKWDGLMIPYYRSWAYLYGSYGSKARPQRLQAADRYLQRLAGNKRLNKAFLPKVLSLRGRVLLRLKKPTEAIKFLDAAMKSPAMPAFDRLVATLAKSEALNQQAKKKDALKVLDAIRTDGRMGRMVNATPVLLILVYDRRFEITKDFLVYNQLLEDKVVVANKWQQSIKRWMGERVEGPVPSAQKLAKEEPFIVLIWADKLIQRGQDAKAKAEETADDAQKQKLLAEAEGHLKRAGQEMKALLK